MMGRVVTKMPAGNALDNARLEAKVALAFYSETFIKSNYNSTLIFL
jgi:hypothetical protein